MKHHISHILQEKVREASDLLYTLNKESLKKMTKHGILTDIRLINIPH